MLFYLIIVAYIVWICVAFYKAHTGEWDDGSGVMTLVFGGMLTALLTLMVAAIFSSSTTKEVTRHNVCPIVSLRGASEISGNFVLGCGHIGTDEKYYFMYDLGNQTYRRGQINTWETLVRETAAEKPNFSYDETLETNRKCYKWWPQWYVQETARNENFFLNVPPGTIIQKFEVQ